MGGAGVTGATCYRDRQHAGEVLAAELAGRLPPERPGAPGRLLVLGLPRGGVPVAEPVAARLQAQLAALLVRKISTRDRPELALGAVASVGGEPVTVREERVLSDLRVPERVFAAARRRAVAELDRRVGRFGLTPDPAGRRVVVVDDGLATGSTMRAALTVLRTRSPAWLAAAVPVASRRALRSLVPLLDLVVCPLVPPDFAAVGEAYDDFSQVPDALVVGLLRRWSALD